MISVIISSVHKDQLAAIQLNITQTIGVPFEVIAIDNGNGERGICAVYNEGAARASYDLLCFTHEDLTFKTNGWGKIVATIFAHDTDLGLLGVAGSTYRSLSPSGWNGMGGPRTDHVNILQGHKYADRQIQHYYRNPDEVKLKQVACIDGVWFCIPKKVITDIRFDEDTFKGFHAYDLDISMAVGRRYKVAVTFEVLMHHFSEGNFSGAWLGEMLKFIEKWEGCLPVSNVNLTARQKQNIEKANFRAFIAQLIKLNLPARQAYQQLLHNSRYFRVFPRVFFKNMAFIRKAYQVASKQGLL